MKKFVFVLAVLLIASPAFAMGKRSNDPACFASDRLRFQIAEHKLVIPRNDILAFRCTDDSLKNQCSIKKRKICQKNDAPDLVIWEILLRLKDVKFSPPQCEGSHLTLIIRHLPNLQEKPEDRQKLIARLREQCIADKHYENFCQNRFEHKGLQVQVQYSIRCHPIEKTEETVSFVFEKLQQYFAK